MELTIEQTLLRSPARVIAVFDKMETLMSLCLKSKVSYPTISHIIKNLKDMDIIKKDGKYTYNLTEKGIKMRDLLKNMCNQLSIIVNPSQIDEGLQGGQHGRKERKRK